MDIIEYAAEEVKKMTNEQLNILKINYEEELVRANKKLEILSKTIQDTFHPDVVRAKYNIKEAEGNLSFICMCLRAKAQCEK